jgi:hypothetical protein
MLLKHSRLNLLWVRPSGSKVQRMIGESVALAGDSVFIAEQAKWLSAFRNEVIRFPGGKFDDQVDSLSQFLYWARRRGVEWPDGGGCPGRGLPNGPMGPDFPSAAPTVGSYVTPIYSDPPDLDLSELY